MIRLRTLSRSRKARAGFTLPELVMSMIVLSLISLAAFHMSVFVSRSTVETTERVEAVSRAYMESGEMAQRVRSAATFAVYADFMPSLGGYEEGDIERGNNHARLLQDYHIRPPGTGNFLVIVELYDGDDDPDPADETVYVRRLTGYYAGPRTWRLTDPPEAGPEFVPIRTFTLTFEDPNVVANPDGELSATNDRVLEDLLPPPTPSVYNQHRVIGYVTRSSIAAEGLFKVLSSRSVGVTLPLTIGDEPGSATYVLQNVLFFQYS